MALTEPRPAAGMSYYENALDAVGHTPLVRLNRIIGDARCLVLAKVEYMNPGGSVKDRPAVAMIEDAERRGILKPGSTLIEATSGNTGTGLAMAAAIRGYRCILVMPDKMSAEKIDLLKAYGAEVVVTPTNVPNDSPESYYGVANRLTAEIPGAIQPDQWHNAQNPGAHYMTTGPEIWEQTAGRITHFVSGMGTGGTISGTARYLKEKNPQIVVVGADPEGSIYSGDTPKSYKVEGIGMSYLPQTVDMRVIDKILRVTDKESFLMARRIAREEGLLVGGSSGTAVAAAVRVAQELPPEAVMVVVMPDSGPRLHVEDLQRRMDARERFPRGRAPQGDGRRRAAHEAAAAADDHRARAAAGERGARAAAAVRDLAASGDARARRRRLDQRRRGDAGGLRSRRHRAPAGRRRDGPRRSRCSSTAPKSSAPTSC